MCETWNAIGVVVDEQDEVRVAHGHGARRERHAAPHVERLAEERLPRRTAHGDGRLREARDAHGDGDAADLAPVLVQAQPADASEGLHPELELLGEPEVVHELADASRAVSAHLREAAVGVAVVHHERCIGPRGTHQADHAVGADAGPAVAEGGDRIRLKRTFVVQVHEHHEVVAGSLVLGESELVGHSSSHGRERNARIGSNADIGPRSSTSNHRMRGSRRNHAICRLARFVVRLTVASTASSSVISPRR